MVQLWRKDPPELADQGRVTTEGMWPHQKEWWDLPNFVRILAGGFGSGKSVQLCKRFLSLSLLNSGRPVAIVAPTFSMAKNIVVPTIRDLLDAKAPRAAGCGGAITATTSGLTSSKSSDGRPSLWAGHFAFQPLPPSRSTASSLLPGGRQRPPDAPRCPRQGSHGVVVYGLSRPADPVHCPVQSGTQTGGFAPLSARYTQARGLV